MRRPHSMPRLPAFVALVGLALSAACTGAQPGSAANLPSGYTPDEEARTRIKVGGWALKPKLAAGTKCWPSLTDYVDKDLFVKTAYVASPMGEPSPVMASFTAYQNRPCTLAPRPIGATSDEEWQDQGCMLTDVYTFSVKVDGLDLGDCTYRVVVSGNLLFMRNEQSAYRSLSGTDKRWISDEWKRVCPACIGP